MGNKEWTFPTVILAEQQTQKPPTEPNRDSGSPRAEKCGAVKRDSRVRVRGRWCLKGVHTEPRGARMRKTKPGFLLVIDKNSEEVRRWAVAIPGQQWRRDWGLARGPPSTWRGLRIGGKWSGPWSDPCSHSTLTLSLYSNKVLVDGFISFYVGQAQLCSKCL